MDRSAAAGRTRTLPLSVAGVDVRAAGAWLCAFVLVLYLALSGGGYDPVVHSEVGIALWWLVLAGTACGALTVRFGRAGWAAFGLLGAFVAWTALGMTWTESAERTAAELARVATYLGVLALGLVLVSGRSAQPLVNGLACAFGAVAALAVLSRLVPGWFPENDHATFLPEAINRLSYPLNSWNGLASFAAVGLPLTVAAALGARTRAGQALAAAALPVLTLCVFLTASRGGAISAAVGVLAVVALFGDRLVTLATLANGAAGAAVLVWAAAQRDELERGLGGPVAQAQGDELLVLAAIVCAGVGLLQVAIGLAARFASRPSWLRATPRQAAAGWGATIAVALLVALAAGAPDRVSSAWSEFTATPSELGAGGRAPVLPKQSQDVGDRLTTVSGNGRWQYWQSSVDAMRTDPLRGTGPGTFEYWWARNATIPGFVRDAHSLYFETLGETGVIGLGLLAALLLLVLLTGAVRSLRTADATARLPVAAATAAVAVFAVAASVDFVWEVAVLPAAAMLLMAVVLAPGAPGGRSPVAGRVVVGLASLAAIVAIAIPLAGVNALRDSQADVSAGRIPQALGAAQTAERTQPYAATPVLQRALILELAGDYPAAVAAARRATAEEPTNWRTWLTRARVEARAGQPQAALTSFRRARSLNPKSQTLPR